jgi:hypothetical protein
MLSLPGIRLGMGDEFRNRLRRKRWIDLQGESLAADARNWCDVADEIEVEFFVQCSVDRVRTSDQKQRVAIRRRTHDGLGSNISTGTWPVLDDEGLAEPVGQPLPKQAPDDIRPATRNDADDQTHRPRRIGLRPSHARGGRQRGSAGGQVQKISAGKFHLNPPSLVCLLNHLVGATEQRGRHGKAERLRSLEVDD